jgi:hypothetical protein
MQLARSAWDSVDVTTIRNCWKKADLLPATTPRTGQPMQPQIPIVSLLNGVSTSNILALQAEEDLESSLDFLESVGVLQKANRMSLETLLNPEDENGRICDMATDQDIFSAVIEVQNATTEGVENTTLENGPDDVTCSVPSHRDFIHAQMVVDSFLTHADHSPLGQQLENSLRAYFREVRAMHVASFKPTHITDFFTRK